MNAEERERGGGTRGEQEGTGQSRDVAPQQVATRRPHYRSHWHSTRKFTERGSSMDAEGIEKGGARGSRTAAICRGAVGRHEVATL